MKKFEVGDYVEILANGNVSKKGQIGKITKIDEADVYQPCEIYVESIGDTIWPYSGNFRLITDESTKSTRSLVKELKKVLEKYE